MSVCSPRRRTRIAIPSTAVVGISSPRDGLAGSTECRGPEQGFQTSSPSPHTLRPLARDPLLGADHISQWHERCRDGNAMRVGKATPSGTSPALPVESSPIHVPAKSPAISVPRDGDREQFRPDATGAVNRKHEARPHDLYGRPMYRANGAHPDGPQMAHRSGSHRRMEKTQ